MIYSWVVIYCNWMFKAIPINPDDIFNSMKLVYSLLRMQYRKIRSSLVLLTRKT